VVTGAQQMLSERAIALDDFDRSGLVRIHGEIWSAQTRSPVKAGQTLRVTAMNGLVLDVEPETSLEPKPNTNT